MDAVVEQRTGGLQKTIEEQTATIEQLREAEGHRLARSFSANMQGAYDGLSSHYSNFFDKDDTLRGNPVMRETLDDLVGRYTDNAIQIAQRTGDMSRLEWIADPEFARHVLSLVKSKGPGTERLPVYGAETVGPQTAPPPSTDGLPAEVSEALAAARADGYDYSADRIKKALEMRPKDQVE
jgi:hypothetical protein